MREESKLVTRTCFDISGILEKMFGATSNNEERLRARSAGRQGPVDPKKQALNEEWIAKYVHFSYVLKKHFYGLEMTFWCLYNLGG